MFRSAIDAASAAIDYSKGDVEDGVVDSPPSRGPGRTPICSPSPLKRASSNHGRSFSPPPRTDAGTSRKLELPVEDAQEDPRLNDKAPSPKSLGDGQALGYPRPEDRAFSSTLLPAAFANGLESKVIMESGKGGANLIPEPTTSFHRPEDNRVRTSRSVEARRSPSVETPLRQRIIRDRRRSLDSKSTGSGKPPRDYVMVPVAMPPRRVSRSFSASGVPVNIGGPKRKYSGSQSLNVFSPEDGPHYPSRRNDILRGLAKLRAMEAAKSDSSTKPNV